MTCLVDLFIEYFDDISHMLPSVLELITSCFNENCMTDILCQIGNGCLHQLVMQLGKQMSVENWNIICDFIHNHCVDMTPSTIHKNSNDDVNSSTSHDNSSTGSSHNSSTNNSSTSSSTNNSHDNSHNSNSHNSNSNNSNSNNSNNNCYDDFDDDNVIIMMNIKIRLCNLLIDTCNDILNEYDQHVVMNDDNRYKLLNFIYHCYQYTLIIHNKSFIHLSSSLSTTTTTTTNQLSTTTNQSSSTSTNQSSSSSTNQSLNRMSLSMIQSLVNECQLVQIQSIHVIIQYLMNRMIMNNDNNNNNDNNTSSGNHNNDNNNDNNNNNNTSGNDNNTSSGNHNNNDNTNSSNGMELCIDLLIPLFNELLVYYLTTIHHQSITTLQYNHGTTRNDTHQSIYFTSIVNQSSTTTTITHMNNNNTTTTNNNNTTTTTTTSNTTNNNNNKSTTTTTTFIKYNNNSSSHNNNSNSSNSNNNSSNNNSSNNNSNNNSSNNRSIDNTHKYYVTIVLNVMKCLVNESFPIQTFERYMQLFYHLSCHLLLIDNYDIRLITSQFFQKCQSILFPNNQ